MNKPSNNIKKLIIAIILVSLISTSLSVSAFQNTNKKTFTWLNPAIVQISYKDKSIIGKLIENDIVILEIKNEFILVYVSSEDIALLEKENLNPEIIYNSYNEMMGWTANPRLLDSFHNYAQLTTELQNIESVLMVPELLDLETRLRNSSFFASKALLFAGSLRMKCLVGMMSTNPTKFNIIKGKIKPIEPLKTGMRKKHSTPSTTW